MAYIPPLGPGAPAPARRSLGTAVTAGAAAAIVCAFLTGLIGGAVNTQFAYAAVLLGLLVGLAVRQIRRDAPAAVAAGLVSLAGAALASLITLTVHAVKAARVPLSFALAHLSTLISYLPHYIGPLGFACWALAAYTGWATAAGRRRPTWAPSRQGKQPYGTADGHGHQTWGSLKRSRITQDLATRNRPPGT